MRQYRVKQGPPIGYRLADGRECTARAGGVITVASPADDAALREDQSIMRRLVLKHSVPWVTEETEETEAPSAEEALPVMEAAAKTVEVLTEHLTKDGLLDLAEEVGASHSPRGTKAEIAAEIAEHLGPEALNDERVMEALSE